MTQARVAILITGGGSNMEALVRAMTGRFPARPAIVIADDPAAGGLARAHRLSVPGFVVDHRACRGDPVGFEAALSRALMLARVDIICLAGFMRVLSADFVAGWQGRILNIHPSLLPAHKGLHTHARVLAAGDATHGCTVHQVTPALDDGPILGQARLAVLPGDTPDTLAARLLPLEHRLYPAVLDRFARGDRAPLLM